MSQAPLLFILGPSGHAHEVAAYALALHPDRTIRFVDDHGAVEGCLTLAAYWEQAQSGRYESVMGSGRCEVRRRMRDQIRPPFATIVHPSATIMGEVGQGCIIAPGPSSRRLPGSRTTSW